MIIATLEQALACDKRGPSACIWCQFPVAPPCLFVLGANPGNEKWIHIECGEALAAALLGHADAHVGAGAG